MPSEFGDKLRELRKRTGMSQREVAEKVGIDFTYLSKIENGTIAPPKEDKIINLAKILSADEDELITLAGKIPSNLSEVLRDKSVIKLLRSASKKEIQQFLKKKEKGEE